MWNLLALLNQNCRTATRLVLAARERTLSRAERAGLAGHLMICPSCRRYRGQVEQLEQLARDAQDSPADALSADARARIARHLVDGDDPR